MRLAWLQRVLLGLTTAGLLLLSGCGGHSPAAPNPGLSGPVVLVGYLTDSLGRFVGTRVFADADGVPVELVPRTGQLARARPQRGPGPHAARGPISGGPESHAVGRHGCQGRARAFGLLLAHAERGRGHTGATAVPPVTRARTLTSGARANPARGSDTCRGIAPAR